MMFQSYALFPHMSVEGNVGFGLRQEGLPRAEIARRVDEMLTLVKMTPFSRRRPDQLSGGQRQRVALARSLAKKPKVLLLDEPMAALDKKLREETQIELVNIISEVGVTCVMVTHDQEEAMTMATRVAVMSEGKILQVGPPAEIYENPATRFVADFIGNVNLMEGTVAVDEPDYVEIDCGFCRHRVGHGITGNVGMAVSVALRPEKIRLSRQAPEGALNQVKGTIRDRSYFGAFTVYNLELEGGRLLKVSESNSERQFTERHDEGQEAWATWPDTAQVVLVL
jgi:putrescine transport system ATP-binding protein